MRSRTTSIFVVTMLAASFILTTGFSFRLMEKQTVSLTAPVPILVFPFQDVQGNWAEAAIAEMYAKDVMKGYEDSTFKPKKPVTFMEAVVMLDKMLWGKPIEADSTSNVYLHDKYNIPEWALGYVASALRNNILLYNELQKVSLQQPLSRVDAAVLSVRALEMTNQVKFKKDSPLPFTDIDQIDETQRGCVAVAYEQKTLNGYTGGTFEPQRLISRAEMAILLSKIAGQVSSVTADETSGLIKSVSPATNIITLVYGDGKEAQIRIPDQRLIYLNDKLSTIDELTAGNHIRIITAKSQPFTAIMARILVPDNGTNTVFEQVSLPPEVADIAQWVVTNKISERYLAKAYGDNLYFLATRGEKMYNYTIEITKVTSTTDAKGIHYRVWINRASPIVRLPAISYPTALVKTLLPNERLASVTFVDKFNQVIAKAKL